MNGIVRWAAALCTTAVGCAAVQILAPKKGIGKIFRMVLAAFFLCCMIAPLLSSKPVLNLGASGFKSQISADRIQAQVYRQFKQQVTAALFAKISQVFKNYDIALTKVDLNMDIADDQSIYITDVVLYLDSKSRTKAIAAKQLAEEILGVKVNILVSED